MQTIFIAGTVGRDAASKQAGGNTVTEWSVAVSAGRDKETTWYKCSLWGKRGEAVAGYIRKGDKITVTGKLTAGVYDGKPDMKVEVYEVTLQGSKSDAPGRSYQNEGDSRPRANPAPADLDDDVPF